MIEDQLPSADRPISGRTPGPSGLSRLLDREIARYQGSRRPNWRHAAPHFHDELESRFESDTQEVRVRNLNFAMILGGFFFFATALTDPVFVPDLGWDGVLLRCLVVPFMVFDVLVCARVSARWRETLCAFTAALVITTFTAIPALSNSPLAPLAFASAMFAVAYANVTIVLRFQIAMAFTAYGIVLIVATAVLREGIANPLGWAIGLQVLLTGLFSLIANYRIEWSARLSYLLGTREAMRLQAINADREALKTLSSTDELTGLANRGALRRWCTKTLTDPANTGRHAALLMIDVDHFKRYNDHYGHIAGDQCLRAIAQRIAQTVRSENDIVARFGGEEFVVMLLDIKADQAFALAKRICAAVSEQALPHVNRGDDLDHVTISVGIASSVVGRKCTLEGLMQSADVGLYEAKRKGRNRVESSLASAA